MTTHIFNPDTEMALACGKKSYTPPSSVQRFINNLALLPALYASEGDAILIPDELKDVQCKPYYRNVKEKNISLVLRRNLNPGKIMPWGWNKAIANAFLKSGVSPENLPDETALEKWKELAHRRTAAEIFRKISEKLQLQVKMPEYCTDIAAIDNYINECKASDKKIVVKMPWSSSGRGVFFNQEKQIIMKALSKQKGLVLEPYWNKAIDFATEWECKEGKALFKGFSLFTSSETGNYSGNLIASQPLIKSLICSHCESELLDNIIRELSHTLSLCVASYYDGPLGIDMLCDKEGIINPCVEMNLRMTMGHVAIALYDQYGLPGNKPYYFCPGKDLPFE